jgi:NADP-dependent alcohol dehydrogenase
MVTQSRFCKTLIKENALPLNCVDFTGNRKEMNSGAVVTIEATKEKLTFGGSALFPKFSICDPTVIQSLPKDNCKMVWLMLTLT